MSEPLISFAIPAYNRPALLKEALDSILAQTAPAPYEVVVTDDLGLEETKVLVEGYPKDRFRYVRNEKPCGAVANWNRGLFLAKGSWVTVLHEDDALFPQFLELVLPLLQEDTVAVAVKTIQGETMPRIDPVTALPEVWDYPPRFFMKSAMTPFPGVMVRRETALALSGFDEGWGPLADFDFWYRLACAGRVCVVREVGAFYRVSPGQWTERAWVRMLRLGHLMRLRIAREQFGANRSAGVWMARFFTLRNARSYKKRFAERPATLDRALSFSRIRFAWAPSGWVWQVLKRSR